MLTQVSKLAKTIGLAAGLVLIGGSLVGGIALASDNSDSPAPAVSAKTGPTGGGDHHGDDADNDADDQGGLAGRDDESGDGRNGHDDCDEGDSSDDNCTASPTATPSPSRSPHDDGYDHGDDD
jgi:hypothetical protein